MKRILGTVIAFAGVLAFSSAAMAVQITYQLGGVTGSYARSGDVFAASPTFSGGPCPTSMVAEIPNSGGCFRWAFEAGSSVTIEIIGNAVTLLSGELNVASVAAVASGSIVLTTHTSTAISGGTGTLTGDTILWETPTNYAPGTGTNVTMCTSYTTPAQLPPVGGNPPGSGTNCGLISMVPGQSYPAYPLLYGITNTTPVAAFDLGWWILDTTRYSLIKSALVTTITTNNVDEPNPIAGALSFANNVPEPSSAMLVLLGLGALALRSRKA